MPIDDRGTARGQRGTDHAAHRRRSETDPELPAIEHAELARFTRTLESIRSRLLDLSAANRLLNYKHPKGTSLRVIDEVPAQVLSRLLNGQSMSFAPLAAPARRAKDDELVFDGLDGSAPEGESAGVGSADGGSRKEAQARREALRVARARDLGINSSYDLPAVGEGADAQHRDGRIQTLFFPEELEEKLHGIMREAEASVQETGVNRLHLMFGFVRWRESAEAEDWRLAPLVLLPVRLMRVGLDAETHTFKYVVERTGEDWSANVTLQEKCRKEFGIEIPDVDVENEENLEHYFSRVERILKRGSLGWMVKRHLTLGLVSFGKILMWRDLDPKNWPARRPIFTSAPLRALLGADDDIDHEAASRDAVTTEYPLDDMEPGPGSVPPVVVDADSSQHSTLVDIERGVNLVVQGPPGTGKSQTITNLIAAAIKHGKRVLFVAEKKAALDVVFKRLDEAGLGDFCVALHSHTSEKRQFLSDLQSRINLRGTVAAPAEWDTTHDRRDAARERLSAHARRMHSPVGEINLTPFQILWRGRRLADTLGADVLKAIVDLRIPNVLRTGQADVHRRRDVVTEFAAAYQGVLEESASVVHHPWYGVTHQDMGFQDVEDALDAATAWRLALVDVRLHLERIAELTGDSYPHSLASLEHLRHAAHRVNPLAEDVSDSLPAAIIASAHVVEVREAVEAVRAARAAWARVPGRWSQRFALPRVQAEAFSTAVAAAQRLFGPDANVGGLRRTRDHLRELIRHFESASAVIGRVAEGLGLPTDMTVGQAAVFADSVAGARQFGLSGLALRTPALTDPMTVQSLRDLAAKAEQLRNKRAALDRVFSPSLRPSREVLQATIAGLASAPRFLPFLFSSKFRAAVGTYRIMSSGVRADRDTMLNQCRELLEQLDAVAELTRDATVVGVFGEANAGLDAPFATALTVAEWYETTRAASKGLVEDEGAILTATWGAGADAWRAAFDHIAARGGSWTTGASLLALVNEAAETSQVRDVDCRTTSLPAVVRCWTTSVELATGVIDVAEDGAHSDGCTVHDLARRLDLVFAAYDAEAHAVSCVWAIEAIGVRVDGSQTDIGTVVEALDYITRIEAERFPEATGAWLIGADARARLSQLRNTVDATLIPAQEAARRESTFVHATELRAASWTGHDGHPEEAALSRLPVRALIERLELALGRDRALHGWAAYQRARVHVANADLGVLLDPIERKVLDAKSAADGFEAVFFRSLAEAVFRVQRELDTFDSAIHAEVQQRFAGLDARILTLTRQQIAHELASAPAVPGIPGPRVGDMTDEALILHEADKVRRQVPIRELFRRAGRAIQSMKPCFLMGPQAVAQYLPPAQFEFDLVVMDEASQLRPEDALGALARGSQAVIVGDPMQLGPTKFFDKQDDDDGIPADSDDIPDESDEPRSGPTVLERAESILLAAAARFPVRMLRWHYRSRHPKLIAFSNREFYNERLIVFPTPGHHDGQDGVFFTHVRDGVYGARRNEREALAVVEAVRRHAAKFPERSLLVATLNAEQAELIDRLIEEAEKDDPVLQDFRARHAETPEALDVKNLESVQGDERDVIFVSVTFGHDEAGNLFQRFGPILQKGGERRLNVLFTRAKHRLEVFCSFDPSELRVQESSSRGLKVLRDYLRYAMGEVWWAAGTETGREPDSDFEVAVAAALGARGYEVRPQVGVAGYFIDMAIVHPDLPGRFVLGLECDGATYHSAKTARDRDRLRQRQLESLGWRIHRIWSTDWFRDPVGQINRVVARVEELRGTNHRTAAV